MIKIIFNFLRSVGIDRAIGASTITQLMRFLTGPITMLAIIRYLSPEEQGYFYSFAGVMGIQVFLEAGFAQSITQFTSREFAHLRFNERGLLTGSPAALSRLRSIFQKANRYYSVMALVLTIGLALGGYWFFSSKASHGVPWQIPWIGCTFCAGISFLLTPYWAVLEGCNRVADVAVYRLWLTLVGFFATILGLWLEIGIYATFLGSAVTTIFSTIYLLIKWRLLTAQIKRECGDHQVSWRKEIWGFQWRIATTWVCRYSVETGIVPLTFQLFGAASAGQVGMTYQVVRMLGGLSNSWTASKIPMWGALAATNKWAEIHRSWRKSAFQNVIICCLLVSLFLPGLLILQIVYPRITDRFLPPFISLGFVVGTAAYSIWLACSHYTRALRIEPYIKLHIAVAVVFITSIMLTYNTFGISSIPWSYASIHVTSSLLALIIRKKIKFN